MDVIIAARLSRKLGPRYDDRGAQTGIDTQDEDATDWAKRNGHNIVAVVADRIPGNVSPFERKNLGPWLNEPQQISKYQGIVFANISRSGRARDWGFRQWAEDHQKTLFIVFPELQWPPADPMDTITPQMWDMLLNQAIAEWKETSKRYRRMQRALRDNNRLVGRPNYGYRAIKDGDHKILVQDRVLAPLLREAAMVHYCDDGWPLADVCDWLWEKGAGTIDGKPFRPSSLGVIFRNPALYGRRVSKATGRTELRIADPILTRDEWNRLQAKIDKKAGRKGIAPKKTAMLTSVIYCPKCNRPMYRQYSHAHGKGQAYYRCRGTETSASICRNMVPLEELNKCVDEMVESIGYLPHTETVFIPGDDRANEIAEIDEKLQELVADIDSSNFDERLAELRAERKRLQSLPVDTGKYERIETGQTITEFWSSQDDLGKRDYLLNELHWKIYASKNEDGKLIVFQEGGEYFADIAALGGPTVNEIFGPLVKLGEGYMQQVSERGASEPS